MRVARLGALVQRPCMRPVPVILALALPVPVVHAEACGPTVSIRYEPRTFFGYECPDNCERHKAGYAWAERIGLTDASGCSRLVGPYREGCTARIEQASASESAGYRWALENEIVATCECAGGGEGFEAGCRRQLVPSHRRGAN